MADEKEAAPALVMLAAGLAKRYGGCKPLAPLGIHGEAIIDLTASDVLVAGFGRIVVVVGPKTSPAISYHIEHVWPKWADTTTALQPFPLGTAHAVLCARDAVGSGPFGVVNADDVYGVRALTVLCENLKSGSNSIVAFRLKDTVLTEDQVTRGITQGSGGRLTGLAERRKVARHDDGTFTSEDGLEPSKLDPDALVSMNLWGFQPEIWKLLEEATLREHPDIAPDGTLINPTKAPESQSETLLPEVVGDALAQGSVDVALVGADGQCVGVTHADDLPVARAALARMIGRGDRAEWLWERTR